MAVYHVNPETGETRRCGAEKQECPFGSENHAFSMAAARKIYERNQTDRVITSISKKPLVSPSEVTPGDIRKYKQWACGDLALALHEKTGYPLVVLSYDDGSGSRDNWVHAAVQTPEGKILDVEGLKTKQETIDEWSAEITKDKGSSPRWRKVTPRFLTSGSNGQPKYESDANARRVASLISESL